MDLPSDKPKLACILFRDGIEHVIKFLESFVEFFEAYVANDRVIRELMDV